MGNDEHLHKAFDFFDQNQSGYIEIEELRNALSDEVETTSEDVINAIMHDVDTDKVSPFPQCRSIFSPLVSVLWLKNIFVILFYSTSKDIRQLCCIFKCCFLCFEFKGYLRNL